MNPFAHDSQDHDAYAAAMIACQGYAPACSDAGECQHDGVCFSSSGRGFRAAHRAISDLIDKRTDVYTRSWLKVALDALDQEKFIQRGALDALVYVQINKRVRREYGRDSER